jgi:hypothetical protein
VPVPVKLTFEPTFNAQAEPIFSVPAAVLVILRPLIVFAIASPRCGVVKLGDDNGASVLVPEGRVTVVLPVEIILVT